MSEAFRRLGHGLVVFCFCWTLLGLLVMLFGVGLSGTDPATLPAWFLMLWPGSWIITLVVSAIAEHRGWI